MASTSITVFCASSPRVDEKYLQVARETGRFLAQHDISLVYGGGNQSLMGELARAVHGLGGHVVGVIPHALRSREGIAYELADELIMTDTLQERKRIMFDRSEAYMTLPGGIGTLEEFMEVVTLRNLGYNDKPVGLLNPFGYFDELLSFFEHVGKEHFLRTPLDDCFLTAESAEDLFEYEPFQQFTRTNNR
jgi:cytokinin riboside 5'-monophosphate phosphoribohydrolase